MSEAISNSKYGVVVMADLEDAFDAVWRDGAIYKLYEAAIRNNMLSVFDSFRGDHFSRNLVNVYSSNWVQTHTGISQGSLLSPFIFLVYNSDLIWRKKHQTQTMPKIIKKPRYKRIKICRQRGVLERSFKYLSITDRHSDCSNEPPGVVFKMGDFY